MTIRKETEPERVFDSGAKRQAAAGKGMPSLFPGDAYLDICKHFEDGAAHYAPRNWEKGLPLSTYIDSLERHIAEEKMRLTDESHDRAMAWNAICYLATKLRIKAGLLPKELDDLEGVYGKQKPIRDIDIYHAEKSGAKWKWYIYDRKQDEYLHQDLKFRIGCGSDNFYPTKKAAEEQVQKYLDKTGSHPKETCKEQVVLNFSKYCKSCQAAMLAAELHEVVPICNKCIKIVG